MLTIAYVRVSTDDQVEHSPDAQRRRCAEYAAQKNLGPVKFLSDEGQSGKDLERPAMQELVGLIEADQVTNLIVWRMDRLSRDSGDTSRLLRLFEQHCVNVHSLNEGDLETGSASGRFTAGLHGLLAQLEREKIIENIHLGNEQAVRTGYWINRAPTGYNAVDRVLVPNDDAHLIRRAFKLRAGGQSYPQIEQGTGLKYSTVRHALENKVYLGFTRLRDEWFPGKHEPLVSQAEFDAAQRAHTPGRRRGKDLLSGRVRCGECGRITGIDTNGRGKPIYRCRTRGKGCAIPGRSAAGLHRAARLGVELLRTDDQLVEAIRTHFAEKTERAGAGTAEPSRAARSAPSAQSARSSSTCCSPARSPTTSLPNKNTSSPPRSKPPKPTAPKRSRPTATTMLWPKPSNKPPPCSEIQRSNSPRYGTTLRQPNDE